jgi:acetylornithine deacetylase/succinyl-diaminopimelate desuccinylase family protein
MMSRREFPPGVTETPPPDFETPGELVDLAAELIRIPSVTGSEADVMAYAEGWLTDHGARVERLEAEPGRPNLVASIGSGEGPLYAMNGHLDTVPVPEGEQWAHDPWGAEVVDGRLYGRGSFDMKGGCAAIMWAAAQLAARENDLRGQIQVHLVCDEEKGGKGGSKVLAAAMESGQIRRPDGILSGELSWLHVRTAERGLFQFKIRFEGRSAHTARARVDGINAIAVASRAVLALEQHIDRFHPAVGFPVLSINIIDGGTAPNQVPPACTIRVDRRLVPGESAESVLAEVRAVLDGLEDETLDGQHLPVRYQLVLEDDDLPPLTEANMTSSDDPLVDVLWTTTEGILGYRPGPFTDWGGATDARWFRALGIPMVILGPTGRGAHAADEYVDVPSVGAIGEIYHRTLAELLGL